MAHMSQDTAADQHNLPMFPCEERARLLRNWQHAVMILADCVEQIPTSSLDRFEERYLTSLLARDIADEAQIRLALHRDEHGC
jgi:hypothetical protein